MLKIALLLVKIYVLAGKKGVSKLVSQVAAKPTANLRNQGKIACLNYRSIVVVPNKSNRG